MLLTALAVLAALTVLALLAALALAGVGIESGFEGGVGADSVGGAGKVGVKAMKQ